MISSEFQILVISNEGFTEYIILGDHTEHSCTFSTIITAENKEQENQMMSKSHKASSTTATARVVLSANRLEHTL